MLARSISALGSGLLLGCSVVGIRSGYEEPPYSVIETLRDDLEVRRYGPRLAAETRVKGEDREEAQNEAFGALAAFIFGGNRANEDVAMTVPVEVETESESIAMTMPVESEPTDSGFVMRFFMPSRFTRETLPQPKDDRVRIVEVPGQTLAVLRFSGRGRSDAVAAREAELLKLLAASAWSPQAPPSVLFYDPPWTLPFLRRNEVAVPVSGGAESDRLGEEERSGP